MGLPPCHSEKPAWTRLPPWTSCSRHIPRPPASAGAAIGCPAAARRSSMGTCRSPTWKDLPMLLSCRTAAGQRGRGAVIDGRPCSRWWVVCVGTKRSVQSLLLDICMHHSHRRARKHQREEAIIILTALCLITASLACKFYTYLLHKRASVTVEQKSAYMRHVFG